MRILSSCKILAKCLEDKEVTLEEHTDDSKEALQEIFSRYSSLLKNWCEKNDVPYNTFKKGVELSTYYHDFGKASETWQKRCRKIKNGKDVNLPPHAPYSGYFFADELKNYDRKDFFKFIPFLVTVSHHSLLVEGSWDGLKTNVSFYTDVLSKYKHENNISNDLEDWKIGTYKNWLKRIKDKLQRNKNLKIEGENAVNTQFKAEYALMLSLLTTADNVASESEETNKKSINDIFDEKLPNPNTVARKLDKNKFEQHTYIQKKTKDFLETKNNLNQPLLIEAPCGEGKTWTSLMIAKNLFEEDSINRVIFALPTQVTTNNMLNEFEEEYDIKKNWTGIYHSELQNFLVDEEDIDEPKLKEYEYSFFLRPFNVTTIDHLLLSLVNGFKYAPRAFGNLQTSLVVIDEIHYYDNHTLGMIKCLCKILRECNIPHLVMSATVPDEIKNIFSDYKEIKSKGTDFEGQTKKPYSFKYHDDLLIKSEKGEMPKKEDPLNDDFWKVIKNNKDKNIGIITNTVPLSKIIYQKLTEQKDLFDSSSILLYNSQFMRKDRKKKEKLLRLLEKKIKEGNLNEEEKKFCKNNEINPEKNIIFIGTQVAEISLGLSFDTLLTQLAPLDAIIQRGGRLHRNESFPNNKECNCQQCNRLTQGHEYLLHVFETGDVCHPYFDGENPFMENIIDNTRREVKRDYTYTFNRGRDSLNQVYKGNIIKDFDKKIYFEEPYRSDLLFGESPTRNSENGETRIKTRQIDQQYDVLPQIFEHKDEMISAESFVKKLKENRNFFNTIKGKPTNKGVLELKKHMLKISSGQYYRLNDGETSTVNFGYPVRVVKATYDSKIGLEEIKNVF